MDHDAIEAAPAAAPPAGSPLARLLDQPQQFGFFQAVRLLDLAQGLNPPTPAGGRTGGVRFRTPASLAFPPSEVHSLEPAADAPGRLEMTVNFLGLTGPSGALPRHYTEWLIGRAHARDRAAQAFFDLFNHRLLTLFWQAWAKYRPEVGHESGHRRGALDYVHHLVGMGTPELSKRLQPAGVKPGERRLPGAALAYFSGLISQRPHGQGALEQVVSTVVGARVSVVGCHGTFQAIPLRDRTRLGTRNARLGDGLVLGRRVFDRQTALLLRVGPLSAKRFARLLPRGHLLGELVELVRFLTGLSIDLRVKLQLEDASVSRPELGRRDAHGPQLGWNTWLAGPRRRARADEPEFHFSAMGEQSWH